MSCCPETLSQPSWVILEYLGNSGSQPRRKTGEEMLERRALGLTFHVPMESLELSSWFKVGTSMCEASQERTGWGPHTYRFCTSISPPTVGGHLILVPPLSPNVDMLLLLNSADSLALLRAKRFSCCSSSHSLGDNLYRNSL